MKTMTGVALILFVLMTLPFVAANMPTEAQVKEGTSLEQTETLAVPENDHDVDAVADSEQFDHENLQHAAAPSNEIPHEDANFSQNDTSDESINTLGEQYDESETSDYLNEAFSESDSAALNQLPGEEIDFKLKIYKKTFHEIYGRSDSDIGKIIFKSHLMPNNEVKLSVKLKQGELDDIELVGYFNLAHFTMELDGSNAVLNKQHKELMNILDTHLRFHLTAIYSDYDFPEHAFMLVQMLSYWSASPEGYVHEKREIASNH